MIGTGSEIMHTVGFADKCFNAAFVTVLKDLIKTMFTLDGKMELSLKK